MKIGWNVAETFRLIAFLFLILHLLLLISSFLVFVFIWRYIGILSSFLTHWFFKQMYLSTFECLSFNLLSFLFFFHIYFHEIRIYRVTVVSFKNWWLLIDFAALLLMYRYIHTLYTGQEVYEWTRNVIISPK